MLSKVLGCGLGAGAASCLALKEVCLDLASSLLLSSSSSSRSELHSPADLGSEGRGRHRGSMGPWTLSACLGHCYGPYQALMAERSSIRNRSTSMWREGGAGERRVAAGVGGAAGPRL